METKVCSKCKLEKDINDFSNRVKSKDGKRSSCKECDNDDVRKWRLNNKEKVKTQKQRYLKKYPEKHLNRGKIYRDKNKEKELSRSGNWRENNKEYFIQYYQKNKSEISNKSSERKKIDVLFKLSSLYRSRLNKILGPNKNLGSFEIIGCSPQELKEHLGNQFNNGMSWENHGLFGWHIDHIIPLSSAKTEDDLIKLCHYTNLQPLWAKDNLRKSNKLDYLYVMVKPNI
jgi:hypothetical protein